MGSIPPAATASTRWTPSVMGTRPVRIANCSGARGDPGYQFVRQATLGDVDFITGDYLAEMNLAENAVAMKEGKHNGWEPMCWEGLEMGLEHCVEKGIKIVVNGGALNPGGLARKVHAMVRERGWEGRCKVGWVEGDDLLGEVKESIEGGKMEWLSHLDGETEGVKLVEQTRRWLEDRKGKPVVSANAYLGARGIMEGLRRGCDVIICGRVADASPVIGAAWYWWGWGEDQYDELAGTLVAGHLIECSAYVTGSNFSGFYEYELDRFVDLSFGIAEVDKDGSSVITKHDGTNGLVNVDNVKCQFLYELQGSVYLNSDVTAVTDQIRIEQVGKDRVRLSNVKGLPPPPTTKLAIFYHGGYESQFLLNATGYATAEKYALFEKQLRNQLKHKGLLDRFELLDFQVLGTPAPNPRSQFSSTTYLRVFSQADDQATLYGMLRCFSEIGMQHFSGFHLSLDTRTALPRPYLAFYPALYSQDSLKEGIAIISADGNNIERHAAQHPSKYQKLDSRDNYDTAQPIDLKSLGPTKKIRLGDVALGRSGDKGANINFGLFVRSSEHYPWLQTFMSRAKLQELMGDDWEPDFLIERMEFPHLNAVHFVIYGPLGRGVSSCRLLDALGKGFADYVRDQIVDVPESILADMEGIRQERRSRL